MFVYNPARQVTLLFGGFGDGAVLGETWVWNGSTWSQRLPPVSPSARHGCAAAYDPSTQRIFVFGGVSAEGETNELWAWDGTTWELVTQSAGPAARRDARLAWDTARKRAVLFGGRSGDGAVDFWELSLTGNGCISDDDCHTDTCIEGLCGGPPPEPELDAGPGGGRSEAGSGGAAEARAVASPWLPGAATRVAAERPTLAPRLHLVIHPGRPNRVRRRSRPVRRTPRASMPAAVCVWRALLRSTGS